MTEFHLFLPQMRMTLDVIVEKARVAEDAGFDGIALMDHLIAPGAEDQPTWDAMATATWIAAHTTSIDVGHLVLCDAFRHPAVVAKQAVTIDHASGGRFQLGLGWGSYDAEIEAFGTGDPRPAARFARLAETVEVVAGLWSGATLDHRGDHHRLVGALQRPVPTRPIPIVIGGTGPKTMDLVARHATWWNCPGYAIDRFDHLRERCGDARPSLQLMVAVAPTPDERDDVEAVALRRFGPRPDLVVGTPDELVDRLGLLRARGVERFYLWCTDFGAPSTLGVLGHEVLPHLR
ncbi:MAG: LLM class flavin-dependent oxidoreductase [Actinomycetota bacterium]